MITAASNDPFGRVVDPYFRVLSEETLRQLVEVGSDSSLDDRVEELAGKCNEGTLTAEERAEYEAYVRANTFISLMRAQARKVLADH